MNDDVCLPAVGPATTAARRASRRTPHSRAYDRPVDADLTGDALALAAVRALLAARSREEAAHVLRTAIADLGGAVVPARLAETHPDALSVDVSLGVGEPLLVLVPADSVAALNLARHLPTLVQDALDAARRCDVSGRLAALAQTRRRTDVVEEL